MSSHRVRDLVRGAIALGAVVAGLYVAMPHPTQPSVTVTMHFAKPPTLTA